jgi:menaquinone-dependent protoporphyrinogen IX oxidase
MSRKNFTCVLLLSLGLSLPAVSIGADGTDKGGPTIKKCKDATGQWHYGNSAAAECAKSSVTVMTEEGTTKKVIAAPLNEQELKEQEARKEVEESEKQRAVDQTKKDALLLSTYGVEDDITYIRDRKIAQIEAFIKASEETLKTLRAALARLEAQAIEENKTGKGDPSTAKNIEQAQKQIARHEGVVAEKHKEQDALRQQYAAELARYREIKKIQTPKTPAAAAKQP